MKYKTRGLVLRGATRSAGSLPTAASGAFLGMRSLQRSIIDQPTNAYHRIKNAQGVRLMRESGPDSWGSLKNTLSLKVLEPVSSKGSIG